MNAFSNNLSPLNIYCQIEFQGQIIYSKHKNRFLGLLSNFKEKSFDMESIIFYESDFLNKFTTSKAESEQDSFDVNQIMKTKGIYFYQTHIKLLVMEIDDEDRINKVINSYNEYNKLTNNMNIYDFYIIIIYKESSTIDISKSNSEIRFLKLKESTNYNEFEEVDLYNLLVQIVSLYRNKEYIKEKPLFNDDRLIYFLSNRNFTEIEREVSQMQKVKEGKDINNLIYYTKEILIIIKIYKELENRDLVKKSFNELYLLKDYKFNIEIITLYDNVIAYYKKIKNNRYFIIKLNRIEYYILTKYKEIPFIIQEELNKLVYEVLSLFYKLNYLSILILLRIYNFYKLLSYRRKQAQVLYYIITLLLENNININNQGNINSSYIVSLFKEIQLLLKIPFINEYFYENKNNNIFNIDLNQLNNFTTKLYSSFEILNKKMSNSIYKSILYFESGTENEIIKKSSKDYVLSVKSKIDILCKDIVVSRWESFEVVFFINFISNINLPTAKIYLSLLLLQGYSSYLTFLQQEEILEEIKKNELIIKDSLYLNDLYKYPVVLNIIPIQSKINFDILTQNSKENNDNQSFFLYNPFENKANNKIINLYWTKDSYQYLKIKLKNIFKISIKINNIKLIFNDPSLAISFPSSFILPANSCILKKLKLKILKEDGLLSIKGISYSIFDRINTIQFCDKTGNGLLNHKPFSQKETYILLENIPLYSTITQFDIEILNKSYSENDDYLELIDSQTLNLDVEIKNMNDKNVSCGQFTGKIILYGYKRDNYKINICEVDLLNYYNTSISSGQNDSHYGSHYNPSFFNNTNNLNNKNKESLLDNDNSYDNLSIMNMSHLSNKLIKHNSKIIKSIPIKEKMKIRIPYTHSDKIKKLEVKFLFKTPSLIGSKISNPSITIQKEIKSTKIIYFSNLQLNPIINNNHIDSIIKTISSKYRYSNSNFITSPDEYLLSIIIENRSEFEIKVKLYSKELVLKEEVIKIKSKKLFFMNLKYENNKSLKNFYFQWQKANSSLPFEKEECLNGKIELLNATREFEPSFYSPFKFEIQITKIEEINESLFEISFEYKIINQTNKTIKDTTMRIFIYKIINNEIVFNEDIEGLMYNGFFEYKINLIEENGYFSIKSNVIIQGYNIENIYSTFMLFDDFNSQVYVCPYSESVKVLE